MNVWVGYHLSFSVKKAPCEGAGVGCLVKGKPVCVFSDGTDFYECQESRNGGGKDEYREDDFHDAFACVSRIKVMHAEATEEKAEDNVGHAAFVAFCRG